MRLGAAAPSGRRRVVGVSRPMSALARNLHHLLRNRAATLCAFTPMVSLVIRPGQRPFTRAGVVVAVGRMAAR
jgi:hypothetical protein